MKFNHLNVPTHWRNYWSRYPEGHTILEALISWVSQVDSMVDNQNKLNDNVEQFRIEIDAFVERFDERLQDEVTQTLKDWQDSGFLDVVISDALQWQLDDYIATNEQDKFTLNEHLNQIVMNVKTLGVENDNPNASLIIKQAINDFNGDELELYFPQGTYDLSAWNTVFTLTKKIKIIGKSKDQTVIKGLSNLDLFDCQNSIEIENVTFDTWNNVFNFDSANKVEKIKIKNCRFKNIGASALRWHTPLAGAKVDHICIDSNEVDIIGRTVFEVSAFFDRAVVTNNKIKNVNNATVGIKAIQMGLDGLQTQGNYKHITIKDNDIENVICGSSDYAVGIMACGVETVITGNFVTNVSNLTGTDCEGIYSKTIRGVIADNVLTNAGKSQGSINIKGGLRAAGTSVGGKGYSIICSNNHINVDDYTHTSHGISIQTEDIIVSDNIIEGVSGFGICCVGLHEKRNIKISGNIIRNCFGTHGIWTQIPIHNLIISENIVDGIRSSAEVHGIRVSNDAAWNGTNIKITNNTITKLTTTDETKNTISLYFSGASTGKLINILVQGNHFGSAKRGLLFTGVNVCENVVIDTNLFETMSATTYSGTVVNPVITNNIGYKTQNNGTATIVSGKTSVNGILHGLNAPPTVNGILITPTTSLGNATNYWVSSANSTQFTITIDTAAGSDITFSWFAYSMGV